MDIYQQIRQEILFNFPEGFFGPGEADTLAEKIADIVPLLHPLNVAHVYVRHVPYGKVRVAVAIREARWYIPPPMTLYVFPDPCADLPDMPMGETIHTQGWIVSVYWDTRIGPRPGEIADMLKREFLKTLPDETARKLKPLIFKTRA